MGSKSGGGAGPMLEYGDKALALQEKIYNQSRDDSMPWLQAGGAGLNELTKRLGLSTASSPANRESLINQYTPQFTTSTTSATPAFSDWARDRGYDLSSVSSADRKKSAQEIYNGIYGGSGQKPTSTVDSQGLNSYVDNLISQQSAADQNDPNYGSLLQNFDASKFQADPGYDFRLGEGQKALERKLNASGKTYSPEAAKALLEYNQNFGSNEYQNAYNRYNADQDNIYNRLAGLSGVGQQASAQLANQGANYSNQASDILTGQGNAIVGANQARAAGNQSMFNTLLGAGVGLGSAGSGSLFASMFSDRRLKWDITEDGEENGIKMYTFRYNDDPSGKLYRGVMAQDILETHPFAVEEIDLEEGPRYRVNYDLLGIEFKEVPNAA